MELEIEKSKSVELPKKGRIFVVGGGPGNPKLLTLAAVEILRCADSIVIDRLLGVDRFRPYFSPKAEILLTSEDRGLRHGEILNFIADAVSKGKTIVRLKSGDPMVFGCTQEELEWIRSEEIHFECIPGISALNAGATCGGFPLTQKGVSDSVYFTTGHDLERLEDRWALLVEILKMGTTLGIFMGVRNSRQIASSLLLNGANPKLKFWIVSDASGPNEIVFKSNIGQMAIGGVSAESITPGTIYVGKVLDSPGLDN